MSWFSRKPKARIVSVSFRSLTSTTPADPERAYAYVWELPESPVVGMRVIVPGGDGKSAPAVVAEVDVTVPRSVDLKAVSRIVAPEEITAAHAHDMDEATAWLEMARKAAGLPSSTRRRTAPQGYPPIAPADGEATPQEANEHGRMWWRAYKLAQEMNRDADEIKRFGSIAHRWYAIRDRA
ncbi:hypothetical protein [Microbacterium sp. No. 7]|uniref:hypothetical protein n=1 Tax=Microbacterium sp. No. 7 TaxID=1714373 RepID=UPI0006ED36ED|nr:hypothetical protein [Microbacterium sp. No. 7]ALJ20407.1 hypothetical protein AOA12_11025 [Microbacterium sp. No. 7]